jgi:NTP pyrophosphatase (non-canonical NTP hydrolase)
MIEKILQEIEQLSLNEKKSLLEKMVKLQEECGELAQEVLIHSKSSGSQHKEIGADGIKGECIDVILVALSIFFKEGGDVEECLALLNLKASKWKKHQQ